MCARALLQDPETVKATIEKGIVEEAASKNPAYNKQLYMMEKQMYIKWATSMTVPALSADRTCPLLFSKQVSRCIQRAFLTFVLHHSPKRS